MPVPPENEVGLTIVLSILELIMVFPCSPEIDCVIFNVEPFKYEYRIGLETLVVRAVNQWVLHVLLYKYVYVNA